MQDAMASDPNNELHYTHYVQRTKKPRMQEIHGNMNQ